MSPVEGNYGVLSTDYDNYLIVYTCMEYLASAFKIEYVWVLTRVPWVEESAEWQTLYQEILGVFEQKIPFYDLNLLQVTP